MGGLIQDLLGIGFVMLLVWGLIAAVVMVALAASGKTGSRRRSRTREERRARAEARALQPLRER